jgi:hypothetical protein
VPVCTHANNPSEFELTHSASLVNEPTRIQERIRSTRLPDERSTRTAAVP